jgi:hypothetical protein
MISPHATSFSSTGGGVGTTFHTTTRTTSSSSTLNNDEKTTTVNADNDDDGGRLFLHIGPSGDCWTGTTIFAAKHLQPGYVKSIPLMTTDANTTESSLLDEETIVSLVEEDVALQRLIYDSERIDYTVLWEKLVERQRQQQQHEGEPTTTGKNAASPSPPHSSF